MTAYNMTRAMMAARWTVKNIRLTFGVSGEFARMYLQPLADPAAVLEVVKARAAIERDF